MIFDKIIYGAKTALPSEQFGQVWPHNPIENVAIAIKNNKIAQIGDNSLIKSDAKEIIKLDGGILTPGFIDTQVNGGGGVLFNDEPNAEGVSKILEGHRKFGTTSLLPTLISDDLGKIKLAIEAVRQAIESGNKGIIGIHLEGPFLNKDKKGIHDDKKFGTLNDEAIDIISSLKIAPTLITIAPELQPEGTIEKLYNKQWVILSAGHTNATATQMMLGVEKGISCYTHLFNAMTQMSAREPGVVGFALSNRMGYCGIIIDLVHVDPMNIRLAYDILGPQKLMIVTDSMSTIGTNETSFKLFDKIIHVRDGSCYDENGTLAGSSLDMSQAVKNAHFKVGIPMGSALQMASETPARAINLHEKIGSIRIGLDADLIHLDDELNFIKIV